MKRTTIATGLLSLGLLLGSGSCILACGCGRPPDGVVRGTVYGPMAEGVSGAALELRDAASSGAGVTQVTGADGTFAFTGVGGQGRYTLRVQPPSGWSLLPGQPASVDVTLGAQDTVVVAFIIRPD